MPISTPLPLPVTRAPSERRRQLLWGLAAWPLVARPALAQTPPAEVRRLRGTLQKVESDHITLLTRDGDTVTLALGAQLTVAEVYPITLAEVQAGSFIGTAALPQTDGSLQAIALTVFPESARGLGEGHRPFDLQADSTMTNATVADVVSAPTGRTLQLRYAGGQKTLQVPAGTPPPASTPGATGSSCRIEPARRGVQQADQACRRGHPGLAADAAQLVVDGGQRAPQAPCHLLVAQAHGHQLGHPAFGRCQQGQHGVGRD